MLSDPQIVQLRYDDIFFLILLGKKKKRVLWWNENLVVNAALSFFPILLWKTKFFLYETWAVGLYKLYVEGEISSWSILVTDTRITQGQYYA